MPRCAGLIGRWAITGSLLLLARGATAQVVEPVLLERTGVFAAKDLSESSGVAVSRRHPGLLWTHNDSGDDPLIYPTNLAGEWLGAYRLAGVEAVDWEDIALGPCPDDRAHPCLYVGDTGDNLNARREVLIHILPEPEPPARRKGRPERLRAHSLHLRYPDGPHDVEALAVHQSGDIYLVTKGRSGPIQAFRVPAAAAADSATAVPAGVLPITPVAQVGQLVTGAAFSPGGDRLVVRTYTQLFFFRRRRDGSLAPDGLPCWLGLREPQGEGVAFLDARTLVLTSEANMGRPGVIHRARCP
jgi:hypothetical protein